MIAHTSLAVKDYAKAKEFYKKALEPLGYTNNKDMAEYKVSGFSDGKNTDFWIEEKKDAQHSHIAFIAKNKKAVEVFHKAALEAGGKDNGAPGYRKDYSPGYYAAFIHDPDGSNIEAVWFDPKAK